MKDLINDWETPIEKGKQKEKKDYKLDSIYEHAHSELSLQQSKRDQIITIYLALCSFLIPFALGEDAISWRLKGLIFIVVGIIGVLFSLITIRYREYKEVYWLCCQAITVLLNFKPEEIDKSTVQRTFFHCLKKKGKSFLKGTDKEVNIDRFKYAKKNFFSSETIHFMIIDLMTSFIMALGASLIFPFDTYINIIVSAILFIAIFSILLSTYFNTCIKIYEVLSSRCSADKERGNLMFNKAFSKAWFLHFYYEGK